MKYLQLAIILIILFLFFSENIFSQDIITLKNGEEIKSKVTEVGGEEIKYKKFSNINGPTYCINKAEVFMIKYENGEKDIFKYSDKNKVAKAKMNKDEYLKIDFKTFETRYYEGNNRISKREFISKIDSNPVAYNQYSLGKNLNTVGNIIGIPAGIIFGHNIGTWLGGGEQPSGAALAVSGICWGGGIVLNYVGRSKIRNSIDTYNTSDKFGLYLNINENGIGLALRF